MINFPRIAPSNASKQPPPQRRSRLPAPPSSDLFAAIDELRASRRKVVGSEFTRIRSVRAYSTYSRAAASSSLCLVRVRSDFAVSVGGSIERIDSRSVRFSLSRKSICGCIYMLFFFVFCSVPLADNRRVQQIGSGEEACLHLFTGRRSEWTIGLRKKLSRVLVVREEEKIRNDRFSLKMK